MPKKNIGLSDQLLADIEMVKIEGETLADFIREAARLYIVKRQREALEGLAFRAALSGDIHHGATIIENLQEE